VSLVFLILALLTALSAVASISLRNLVHCALALTLTFAGLAALYLQLNAQFVGFAQVLVYIGAVAILIVFAILVTRGAEPTGKPIVSGSWLVGGAVALCVFAVLGGVILSSAVLPHELPLPPQITVRQIGDQLMTRYVLPLEVLGLLLTAALIGAVILALRETATPGAPNSAREHGRRDTALGGEGKEEANRELEDERGSVTVLLHAPSMVLRSRTKGEGS